MTCKRSKQCDHADICQFAKSDDYHLLGGSCFTPKDPQTNDEWRRTCSTEEFAKFLFIIGEDNWLTDISNRDEIVPHEKDVVEWLKQPHPKE